jgi:hypothetical protein
MKDRKPSHFLAAIEDRRGRIDLSLDWPVICTVFCQTAFRLCRGLAKPTSKVTQMGE